LKKIAPVSAKVSQQQIGRNDHSEAAFSLNLQGEMNMAVPEKLDAVALLKAAETDRFRRFF
jgi:hypothetical protein